MDYVDLYPPDSLLAPVEEVSPLDSSKGAGSCRRCSLSRGGLMSVCTSEVGEPGGVLVVGPAPDMYEDRRDMIFTSEPGKYARRLVDQFWDGPAAFDNAVKCYPKEHMQAKNRNKKHFVNCIASCRPYLGNTVKTVKPERILVLGAIAANGVLGRAVQPYSVRRGYTFLSDGTPVFFMFDPYDAMRNKFVGQWFESDMEWALTCPIPQPTMWDSEASLIRTRDDALAACESLRSNKWFAYDTETAGRPYSKFFQVLCLAACRQGSDYPYVWDREALTTPELAEPLFELIRDPKLGKVGHNLKYEGLAMRAEFGVVMKGWHRDTMNSSRLIKAGAVAKLEVSAELTGMGGHKDESKYHVARACFTIAAAREEHRAWSKKGARLLNLPGFDNEVLEAAVQHPEIEPRAYAFGLIPKTVLHRRCALDTLSTTKLCERQEPQLHGRKVFAIHQKIVMPATQAYEQIEAWGMGASVSNMQLFNEHMTIEHAKLTKRLARYGDFNPGSRDQVADLMYNKLGIPYRDKYDTESGLQGTGAAVLKQIKHPFTRDLLEFRRIAKLLGTYSTGLIKFVMADGRVHANFKVTGTDTGRPSCVASWTLVRTRRGQISIEAVRVGDEVWTHRKRWRPVSRVIVKGVSAMADVKFSNGQVLTCTIDHKLLCSDGQWITAGELVGHECFQELDNEQGKSMQGCSAVSVDGYLADSRDREAPKNNVGECISRAAVIPFSCRVSGVTAAEVLCFQARQQESDEGQEWRQASFVEGCDRGRVWLSYDQAQGSEGICAQSSDGKSFGVTTVATGVRYTPYRWRQDEQRARQSSSGDTERASRHSLFAAAGDISVTIAEAKSRGSLTVYDLTVDDDHSYETCGIFSHNCADPNLQNLPRPSSPEGAMVRNCFLAEPGNVLIEADYSQQELRVAGMLSGDEVMLRMYQEGKDLHMETARTISRDAWNISPEEVTSYHRTESKSVTFGLMFGKTDGGLAEELGCSKVHAGVLRKAILGAYVQFAAWCKRREAEGRKTGEIWTWWDGAPGRVRPLWEIGDVFINGRPTGRWITAHNSFVNTPIQGTASEYCVASAIEVVKACLRGEIPARVVVTIHDAIMLECREEDAEHVARQVGAIMVQWPTLMEMPLVVDYKKGRAMGALEDYKLSEAA